MSHAVTDSTPSDVSFARDVLPILSNHCFRCHGPDDATRAADLRLDRRSSVVKPRGPRRRAPVINPGNAADSALIKRVRAAHAEDLMPPPDAGAALTELQITTLESWINAGAEYETHWSFVPPERDDDTPSPDDVIDHFIDAAIADAGLTANPPADLSIRARRAALDFTGLPPDPDALETLLAAGDSVNAWANYIDTLLASPHFGERWASVWIDLARFADTKGYESDLARPMWPYRDWVIDAFNRNLPFDEFTIEQLAGDLLDAPTDANRIATAFHRNTMTNGEGGTDPEEFRMAAVLDRTNTTMQTWMGITMGCAQCHTHKYDPITQREYYEFLAYFNQSADANRADESPTFMVIPPRQRERYDELMRTGIRLDSEQDARQAAALALVKNAIAAQHDDASVAQSDQPSTGPSDFIWIDDDVPAGGSPHQTHGPAPWNWIEASDSFQPRAGERSMTLAAKDPNAFAQFFIVDPILPLVVGSPNDVLFASVLVNASDDTPATRELMLQFRTERADWGHRGFWGDDAIEFGETGTASRFRLGDLPDDDGTWHQLRVRAGDVGLVAGDRITGWAFSHVGGTATWDRAGIHGRTPQPDADNASFSAWKSRIQAEHADNKLTHADVIAALQDSDDALIEYWIGNVAPSWRTEFRSLERVRQSHDQDVAAIRAASVALPIMQELTGEDERTTHILAGGNYLAPEDAVTPGTPTAFHSMPDDAPRTRLGLARWLVSHDNPLTARVTVNRTWARIFGNGLVLTEEDFGVQGMAPSHPELLDALAVDFMDSGWDFKLLCRRIALSSTYQRKAMMTDEILAQDPTNRLLATSPRTRVDAEVLRDQALAASGLLEPTIGGPSVFPPQPDGVWQMVYSAESWQTAMNEDRFRRGLYTFVRRTSPYPSMITFDGTSREVCTIRRIRTNTPLQALTLLNDPVMLEAAAGLAMRSHHAGDTFRVRARRMIEQVLIRPARDEEVERLVEFVQTQGPPAITSGSSRPRSSLWSGMRPRSSIVRMLV